MHNQYVPFYNKKTHFKCTYYNFLTLIIISQMLYDKITLNKSHTLHGIVQYIVRSVHYIIWNTANMLFSSHATSCQHMGKTGVILPPVCFRTWYTCWLWCSQHCFLHKWATDSTKAIAQIGLQNQNHLKTVTQYMFLTKTHTKQLWCKLTYFIF